MKRKVLILLIILLLTTGCTCQYNVKIDGNSYKETIYISSSDSEEIKNLNTKWEIPVDKDVYNSGDKNTDYKSLGNIYNYSFSNNKLNFYYNFDKYDYPNSTAASLCYKTLSVTNFDNNTVISTSNGADCFDTYPNLTNLVISITIDKEVVSNNADKKNGNTYIWNFNRKNAKSKGVNLTYVNVKKEEKETDISATKTNDYTMYIIAGVLLIVALFAYFIINNIMNKNDEMDD